MLTGLSVVLVLRCVVLRCVASHQVMNRTSIKVSLAGKGSEARGWLPEGQNGTLSVRVINTGGGMFQFEEV